MNYASATHVEWAVEIEAENDKLIDLLDQMRPMIEDYCELLCEGKINQAYIDTVTSLLRKIKTATEGT
jgi:hypothetical protein